MIDFHLKPFIDALAYLNVAQSRANAFGRDPHAIVDAEELGRIGDNLARIKHECLCLDMPTAINRICRLMVVFEQKPGPLYSILSREIDELFDAVERDAGAEYFCHYRKDKLQLLRQIEGDWGGVFVAFKSSKSEIEEGVDSYALGHNLACVFHMSRVGEIGLRAVAKERGIKRVRKNVPLDWGTWGDVFKEIDKKVTDIRQKPNGSKKDAALMFYDTITSDLHAIKSLYRDSTMHLRKTYDDGEAQSAMFRVKELMNTLSSKISEDSSRAIAWGI